MSTERVHYDDVKLEYKKDIEGWVDSSGVFYGNNAGSEQAARWSSCTTVTCKGDSCFNHITKLRAFCDTCSQKNRANEWHEAKKRPISNSDVCYYSARHDIFITDLEEEMHDHNSTPESLLLYHCEREEAPSVCLASLYEDITPDDLCLDDMITDEIREAAETLNELMQNHPVNSFRPTKTAVQVK